MAAVKLLFMVLVIVFPGSKGENLSEKTITFYMHDIVSGKNQTAMPILVPRGSSSNNGFGSITVIDDMLTELPDPSSKIVGRGQGMYVAAAQDTSSFLLVFTAVLHSPDYNNSTINFHGADRYLEAQRDISVVGGTGVFKYAQGYATIQTVTVDGFNAVLKFTVSLRY
eukprot:Gb_39275 [translate_table: standard]